MKPHAEKKAKEEDARFQRFTLKDMRPPAVTDRVQEGGDTIMNATGHSSDRMVEKVYDRRKIKVAKATEQLLLPHVGFALAYHLKR